MSGAGHSYYSTPYSNPDSHLSTASSSAPTAAYTSTTSSSRRHQHSRSQSSIPPPQAEQHYQQHQSVSYPSPHQQHLAPSPDTMPSASSRNNPRRASRASSHGASEPESDVKLTRTGRISKALKGQRVHKCVYCDKIFTRAEHCRRHQLNHGPPQVCNVPGCDKKFYREDLFQRHKEEHAVLYGQSQPTASPSILPQTVSRAGPYPHPYNPSGAGRPHDPQNLQPFPPDYSQPYFNINHDPFGPLDAGYASNPPSIGPQSSLFTSPGQLSTAGFGTPEPAEEFYGQGPPYFPLDFPASMDGTSGSRSPASVSSSIPHNWNHHEPSTRVRDNSSPSESEMSMRYDPTLLADLGDVNAFGLQPALHDPDQMDEVILVRELAAAIPGFKGGPDALAYLGPQKIQFMESYWRHFHHQFPVIHRPTFDAVGVPILLSALMLVLGAQYMDDPAARQSALTLRDACLKVLQHRAIAPYANCRLWDMQIIFLAETLSMYRSRRPMVKFSSRFESLCTGLHNDPDVLFAKPLQSVSNTPEDSMDDTFAQERQRYWVHSENKRRLFLACHILEAQHQILFETQRMISNQDVPMPCSSQLWEAATLQEWCTLAEQEPAGPVYLYESWLQSFTAPVQFDNFNSSLLIVQSSLEASSFQNVNVEPVLDQSNDTSLTLHTFGLAKHIPIRALLSVSGETFVFGQKLATPDQYTDAKLRLQEWRSSADAATALQHALCVLANAFEGRAQHQQPHRRKSLHEDWGLNLAALVCWALAMWPEDHQQQQQLAVEQQHEDAELESRMAAFLSRAQQRLANTGLSSAVDVDEARACLAWARSQLRRPLVGGLLGDAGEVLAKLVQHKRRDPKAY